MTRSRYTYYVLNPDGTTTGLDDPKMGRWQSAEERRVDRTELVDGIFVSTVFLAIDHGWGDGPPELFETMIFEGEYDQWCERYSTLDEAKAGHARIVAALREGRDPGGES